MTDPILPFLKELIQLPGLSGHEALVGERVRQEWDSLVDEISLSRLGTVHALKRGSSDQQRPQIMLAAHMDAIGLMVTGIVDGLLRVTEVGGLDARVLPSQPVTVHGRQDLPGLLVQPPPSSIAEADRKDAIPVKYLFVDLGLPERRVRRQVRVGDLVSFAQDPIELGENILVGHSLDNRASLAAVTICLQELQGREHAWDLLAAATVQEEETLAGAFTSAYQLRPALAMAVDVTWGRAPGLPEHKTFPLGEGPTNGYGPNLHPGVHAALKAAAERVEIPLTDEIMPMHSGTDAYALQIAAEGVPTGYLGIPLLNMHTAVEQVSLIDIRRAGRLLAELVAGLSPDFHNELTLD